MPEEMFAIAQAVMDHAGAHYTDGGWDVIVECWELSDIIQAVVDVGKVWPCTKGEAIEILEVTMVAVWADRQADAEYHRNQA